MSQSQRYREIMALLHRDQVVSVEDLAQHFNVTVQTIRRDLTDLAESGRIERVHGGAILPSGTVNIRYEERRTLQQSSKRAMAQQCAASIPNGASVFLNIGTSTEAVAQELLHHKGLMVVTNNLNVAQILSRSDECDVYLTAGQMRRSDGGLVGNLAIQSILQFKFDIAIIGCSALDQDGDILDFDVQEVAVSQTIVQQSRKTYLVADHTKFERTAPARIGSLADIDTWFTDAPASQAVMQLCAQWDTRIVAPSVQTATL